jgi:ABC-type proline/glycine betaine transport system ATPase subunit
MMKPNTVSIAAGGSDAGRIEQYGEPADVRRNPKTQFVQEFLSA